MRDGKEKEGMVVEYRVSELMKSWVNLCFLFCKKCVFVPLEVSFPHSWVRFREQNVGKDSIFFNR